MSKLVHDSTPINAEETDGTHLVVERDKPDSQQSRTLLQASHALMERLFPPEENHYLSIDELCQPNISFFTAKSKGKSVGCVALARLDGYGEVKSLFVADDARKRGVGRLLMQRLIHEARCCGLSTLKLETGDSLKAAINLYSDIGFEQCGPFGDYEANQTSVFMQLPLAAKVLSKDRL